MRVMVLALLVALLLPDAVAADGARHARHRHQRAGLVSKFMEGRPWDPAAPEIVVVNHSHIGAADVTAAVNLWRLPRVPSLRVVQAEPMPCRRVRPQRGVVQLCVGPATDAFIGGRMFSYTNRPSAQHKHRTQSRQQYRQAAMVWIVDRPDATPAVNINVVAHEVGHALGLPHLACDCIMRIDARGNTELAPEDLAALRLLYP